MASSCVSAVSNAYFVERKLTEFYVLFYYGLDYELIEKNWIMGITFNILSNANGLTA